MRKFLMIAGAAAMAVSMPSFAKEKENGGGKGGGPKAEQGNKGGGGGHHGGGGNGGGGRWDKGEKAGKEHKRDHGSARQEIGGGRGFKQAAKAERNWAKAERKQDKEWRKAESKSDKQWAKREQRIDKEDRRFRSDRPRRDVEERTFGGSEPRFVRAAGDGCPPGLAKKNNDCLPPGQAKKLFRVGERVPVNYYESYNLPDDYRDWYYDNPDYSYRYDDGNIYRIDNQTSLISALIPLLGGGFSVGNLLPAGYDIYNLPVQYRDDYQDTDESYYRYGDEAIYQVDPQTQMIESVVALLAGDLNVGQLLPSGYDTYNLPMDYRDEYVDSDQSLYRYADGNIYEVDPQSRIIESIVAQLV
jgi:hypothetical protein